MLKRFNALSRRKRMLVLGAVLTYGLIGLTGGCNAYRRPPALNTAEQALLQGAPLPCSVTVALRPSTPD